MAEKSVLQYAKGGARVMKRKIATKPFVAQTYKEIYMAFPETKSFVVNAKNNCRNPKNCFAMFSVHELQIIMLTSYCHKLAFWLAKLKMS